MIAQRDSGFTLVEVLVAMFLIGLGLLAAAPMFVFAMQGNQVGEEIGTSANLALDRLETLRSMDYANLVAGGSLNVNTTGYFDASDPRYLQRWTIVEDVPIDGTKTITVRVLSNGIAPGARRDVTLTTVRGR